MTPESFLSWLDKEIEKCEYGKLHYDWHSHNTALQCFKEVKQQFLTLQYPPQPIDPTTEEQTINPPGN